MVIKLFHRHSLLACVCLLVIAVALCMAVNFSGGTQPVQTSVPEGSMSSELSSQAAEPPASSSAQQAPPAVAAPTTAEEMRAVWVPYMSLDMSKEEDRSESAFQKKFDAIIAGSKAVGMNALIVHVRPFGDALYPSEFYPWSHIVGGTQGVNPGYDPMAYMVKATHDAGMEFHAWINPMRVQLGDTPSILAQTNAYNLWKEDAAKAGWIVQTDTGKYFNPAYKEVRKLVADGAKEIAEKYDVDGIQFDDYFYPTEDASFDSAAYNEYTQSAARNGTPLNLQEWRRANVNALVQLTYSEIKSVKPEVQFGISPQANVENDLKIGADVNAWCSVRGYVDYICPQLYVNFENPTLPFNVAADQWKQMVKDDNIKLYFGLAAYKAGSDADDGTWKKSNNILAQQVSLGRQTDCDGFMFYSWEYLNADQTKEEIQNVIKQLNG